MPKGVPNRGEASRIESARKRRNRIRLLMLCTAIHYLPRRWWRYPTRPFGWRKKYGADRKSLDLIESKIVDEVWYRRNIGFDREVVQRYVLWPIFMGMKVREQKQLTKRRSSSMRLELRVLRFLMFMRGSKANDLATLFGCGLSMTYKDIHFMALMFQFYAYPVWVQLMKPETAEYEANRGKNALVGVRQGVYIADIVKCRINSPSSKTTDWHNYYSGKPKCHCFACYVLVDGYGICRNVVGPTYGRFSDLALMKDSLFAYEYDKYVYPTDLKDLPSSLVFVHRHLSPGDKILLDGCLGPFSHKYLTGPITKLVGFKDKVPHFIKLADKQHKASRVIVEHYFANLKNQYRLFRWFTLNRKHFKMFWKCAICLVNIYNVMQSNGLRKWFQCEDSGCYFCVYVRGTVWNPTDDEVELAARFK